MTDGPRLSAPLVTAAAGLACAVVAGAAYGLDGVVSALLAAAVVVAFFAGGTVPFAVERSPAGGPALAFFVLLTNFVLRLLLLLLLLAAASAAGVVERTALGVSVVVCAVVWTHARVLLLGRATPR